MTRVSRRNLGCLAVGILLSASVAARAQVPSTQIAKESGLPYLPGADVWVDSAGVPKAAVPGIGPGQLLKMGVLVFRPRTNGITLDAYAAVMVELGLINATSQPILNAVELPKGEGQNREESFLFRTVNADQYLVLGFITNVRSQNQLVYAVLLDGSLKPAAALLQARSSVTALAERARSQRLIPAPPAGAVVVGSVNRLSGAGLLQLLQGIQVSPKASPRVKKMAQVVIPQATSITVSRWRSAAPIGDPAFVDFYVAQAARLGWGPPIIKDLDQPTLPTLLFQVPDGGGVVMVRAQPEPATPTSRAATALFVLVMEGRIDVSTLLVK